MKHLPLPEEALEVQKQAQKIVPIGWVERMQLAVEMAELKTHADVERLNHLLLQVTLKRKEKVGFWEKVKRPAHFLWQHYVSEEREDLRKLDKIREIGDQKIIRFNEIASKEAEKAQAQFNRVADKMRSDAEKKAKNALREGDVEESEKLRMQAEMIVAPVVDTTGPLLKNAWERSKINIEVTDILSLARAVADGRVPTDAITANEAYLRSQAREKGVKAFNENTPGVTAREIKTLARSTKGLTQ